MSWLVRGAFLALSWMPLPGLSQETPEAPFSGEALRRPVLLVPGWSERAEDLAALRERLLRDGWPEDEVLVLEFADPVGSNLEHAVELEAAIGALLEGTHFPELDIIAHSMGGLAVWKLLQQRGGRVPVRRVVFLATPFQGTFTAYLAWGEGGKEMRPDSEFLRTLAAGHPPQYWVEAMTVRTPLELNVLPGDRATLSGVTDRLVCCPTHQGLLDHEGAYRIVREFLLRGRAYDAPRAGGREGM